MRGQKGEPRVNFVGEELGRGENLKESNPHIPSLPAPVYLRNDYFLVLSCEIVGVFYIVLGVGDDYIYRGTTTFHGVHTNSRLELAETFKDYLRAQWVFEISPEYYHLCVPRFKGRPKDTLDQWLYFLKAEEIEQDLSARGIQREKKSARCKLKHSPETRIYEEFEDQEAHRPPNIQSEQPFSIDPQFDPSSRVPL